MRLKIPLNALRQTTSVSSTVANKSLRIPIGLTSVKNLSRSSNEINTLREIAAASALCNPAKAMGLAGIAEHSPKDVIDPGLDSDELKDLQELLGIVAKYSASDSDDVEVSDSHIAVAKAVSADANSVALAHSKLKDDEALCTSVLKWVASIDAGLPANDGLLARAAKAGTIEVQLNLVPTNQSLQLDLSKRVDSLEENVAELTDVVGTLLELANAK